MPLKLVPESSKPPMPAPDPKNAIEAYSYMLGANELRTVEDFLSACSEDDVQNLRLYLQRDGIRRREIRDIKERAAQKEYEKALAEAEAKREAKLAAERLEANRIYYQIGSVKGTLRKDWLATAGSILLGLIFIAAVVLLQMYLPHHEHSPYDDYPMGNF